MDAQGLNVILTGATGMVGEGVLQVALNHASVEKIVVINRHSCGVSHPKLVEIIHANFFDLSPIESQLSGYTTCLFCLGVSSVGMKKEEYYRLTHTLTLHVAETLSRLNRTMTFAYVSGAGTDSSERGKSRWARIKGKTENDLMKLPFKAVYAFRPGFLKPLPQARRTHPYYKYLAWLYPVGRALYPRGFCTLRELGLAMLVVARGGSFQPVIEVPDMVALAKRAV
jgi:uncharacterized protein YbjT (DUF2867 family)